MQPWPRSRQVKFFGPPRLEGSTYGTENGGDVQSVTEAPGTSPIPEEVLHFKPEEQVKLKKSVISKCLQEAPSGSSQGPRGCSKEIFRVCLENSELLSLLHFAAQDFAHGEVPLEVIQFFTLVSMTAVGEPFRQCQICSARGNCWSSVRAVGATISSVMSRPSSLSPTHRVMTEA